LRARSHSLGPHGHKPTAAAFLTHRRPMQEKAHSWEVEVIKCTEKLATAARERSEMKRAEAEARDGAARVQVSVK